MNQTKSESFFEASTGVAIGYVSAIISQVIIFPYWDIDIEFTENLWIAAWFTVISLIRGYFVRRWYNRRHMKKMEVDEVNSW